MTFRIYNAETNKAINLNEFDALFCQFIGEEEDPIRYGCWYMLLEGVLLAYGDIADNCEDSRLFKSLIKDYRILNLHQAAQALLIWIGRTLSTEKTFDGLSYFKDTFDFFQHYQDKYYISFCF